MLGKYMQEETRDIAIAADTKIDSHVADCLTVRIRIEKSLDDIRDDLKRINWYLPLILGGITVASHVFDIVLGHFK